MKIRAKDVKVKIKGDFAKKKAKVGRKVKKVNETKIDVKAKKIFIPGQNQITKHLADNEREELNLIIRQLHHYSLPNKLGAITELKDLLTKSAHADVYITLILPEVMEMMFDEERDVRKSVISFISHLIVQYQPESFLSIMPVVITYICSGLTNINKGIRKDSLALLQTLCEHGSQLLLPYIEKLLRNVLSLLQDSFQTVSTAGGTQDAHVALSLTTVNAVGAPGASNKDSKSAASAPKVASMFILTLQVLQALLSTAVQAQGITASVGTSEDAAAATRLEFSEHSQLNTIVMLNSRVKGPSSWLSKTSGQSSYEGIPQDLMLEICHRLRYIWQGLVLEDKPIALDTIAVLREIGKIILSVTQTYGAALQKELNSLLALFFTYFPHSCKEATLAKPGSSEERNGNLSVQLLDIALCEIVAVFAVKSNGAGWEEQQSRTAQAARSVLLQMQHTASGYLLEKLSAHIVGVRENTVKQNESNSELVTRIFSSFELMVSIDSVDVLHQLVSVLNSTLFSGIASSGSMTETAAASSSEAMDVVTEDNSLTNTDQLLASDVMQQAVRCVCDIVDAVHTHIPTTPEEEHFFHQLGVALSHLTSARLIVKYLQRSSLTTSSSSVADAATTESPFAVLVHRIIRSLLNLVRRLPSSKNAGCTEEQLQQAQTLLKNYIQLMEYTDLAKNNRKEAFYVYNRCSSETRQLLLAVYAQAPFDLLDGSATLKISKTLNKNIASHSVPRGEQSFFLRLLYDKRHQLSLNDYIDMLFAALRSNITTRCIGVFSKHGVTKLSDSTNKAFHTELIQTALDAASHCFACDVAEVLRWTASTDNPSKIIGFIMSRMVSLKDSAVDAKTGRFTCDASPVGSSSVWVAQFGWLGCYTASVTLLHLLRVLFANLKASDEAATPAVVSVLRDAVTLITSVSLALLRDTGCSASLQLSRQENIGVDLHDKYREELLSTVAILLNVSNIVPSAQGHDLIPNEKLSAYFALVVGKVLPAPVSFSVVRALLVEFACVWSTGASSVTEKTQLLKGLKYLVRSRSVSDVVKATMKQEIGHVVKVLCASVGVIVGETPDVDELEEMSQVANDLCNALFL